MQLTGVITTKTHFQYNFDTLLILIPISLTFVSVRSMPYTHESTTTSAKPINRMAQDAVCHSISVNR